MRTPNTLTGFLPGSFSSFFGLGDRIPWTPPGYAARQEDPRVNPVTGGGRRLVHPYLDDIVYPENPSRTSGFDVDVLRTVKSVLTRTEGGTALVRYTDLPDDVLIQETWDAGGELRVDIEFARLLYQYLITPLPVGDLIGWQPRDRSPYNYFVEIVDIKIGTNDSYHLEEVGSEEPYMLTEPLTLIMKPVGEARAPAGILTFVGH